MIGGVNVQLLGSSVMRCVTIIVSAYNGIDRDQTVNLACQIKYEINSFASYALSANFIGRICTVSGKFILEKRTLTFCRADFEKRAVYQFFFVTAYEMVCNLITVFIGEDAVESYEEIAAC